VPLGMSMGLEVDSEDLRSWWKTTMLNWPVRSYGISIWSNSKKWLRNCLQRRRM
jgi:hypothetical protein